MRHRQPANAPDSVAWWSLFGNTRPAILADSKGPQHQLRYCWWYGSSRSTDFAISEMTGPVIAVVSRRAVLRCWKVPEACKRTSTL